MRSLHVTVVFRAYSPCNFHCFASWEHELFNQFGKVIDVPTCSISNIVPYDITSEANEGVLHNQYTSSSNHIHLQFIHTNDSQLGVRPQDQCTRPLS